MIFASKATDKQVDSCKASNTFWHIVNLEENLTIRIVAVSDHPTKTQRHDVTVQVNQQFSTQSDPELLCRGVTLLLGLHLAHLE